MTVLEIADSMKTGDRFRFPHPLTRQIQVWEIISLTNGHAECQAQGEFANDLQRTVNCRRDVLAMYEKVE